MLLNTFTGTKAWVSGRTIGPSDYRTFGLSIQNRKKYHECRRCVIRVNTGCDYDIDTLSFVVTNMAIVTE